MTTFLSRQCRGQLSSDPVTLVHIEFATDPFEKSHAISQLIVLSQSFPLIINKALVKVHSWCFASACTICQHAHEVQHIRLVADAPSIL